MGRIERLVEQYRRHIGLPWRADLAGGERALFVVYDKSDERRLRNRLEMFELATRQCGHGWLACDLTRVFTKWMMQTRYRDSYFESPDDLDLKLESDFLPHVAARVRQTLTDPKADANTVVAVVGVASLFGFARVSDVMKDVEGDVRGRIAVFFPGEYSEGNYRLLDARDGWNYLAVPITVNEEPGEYRA